jgi:hypothetical protein
MMQTSGESRRENAESHLLFEIRIRTYHVIARSTCDEAIHLSSHAARWIASRSLSSGAHSRDPLARNDVERAAPARAPTSRQLALAAKSQALFGFELYHPEQVAEDLELVAPGQFAQIGNGLRDEGHGLVRAALPIGLIRIRSAISARSCALPAAPSLAQKNNIQSRTISSSNTPFAIATLGRISQLFRYKVVSDSPPINICRFDRDRLTTHVRSETAAASLAEPAFIFSHKPLE